MSKIKFNISLFNKHHLIKIYDNIIRVVSWLEILATLVENEIYFIIELLLKENEKSEKKIVKEIFNIQNGNKNS